MSVITRRPENRLSKTLFAPGGKSIEKALDDAAASLEEVRAERMDELKAKLAEIQALGRRCEKNAKLSDIRSLYGLSSDVQGIAGVYGMPELGQAAYSLCELLDNMGARKVWNGPAVQVHLNGLLLLADPANAPPEARKKVVEGLRQVCHRVSTR